MTVFRAMRTANLEIQTADGVADAYLTRPDDGDRHPGVLFLMDAFGLRPRIEEMADRIAARGYAVLAPNLFYRAGRAPVLAFPDMRQEGAREEFFQGVRPLMAELTPERAAADGAAYLDELAKWRTTGSGSPATAWARGSACGSRRPTRRASRRSRASTAAAS